MVGNSFGDSVCHFVGDSVYDFIDDSVGDYFGDSFGDAVVESVGDSVDDFVGDSAVGELTWENYRLNHFTHSVSGIHKQTVCIYYYCALGHSKNIYI